jgi:transporter family protein
MDHRGWALLSALFAGVTAVLAKRGVEQVPTNLAVAVRVFFVLLFAMAIAGVSREVDLGAIPTRAWGYLVASAVATGASWLCYFRALATGPVAEVAPIDKLSFVVAMALGVAFLKERPSPNVIVGAGLIVVGVLVTLR